MSENDEHMTRANETPEKSVLKEKLSNLQLHLKTKLGLATPTLRDTLEDALKTTHVPESDPSISVEERAMMLRMLHFGSTRVEDIMVPRADIIACEEDEPISELLTTFQNAGVSRVPLFHDTLDDPRGMVHIKDLFRWLMSDENCKLEKTTKNSNGSLKSKSKVETGVNNGTITKGDKEVSSSDFHTAITDIVEERKNDLARPVSIANIRREILYVPPSMPAMNLLIRMQTTRIHMALVVDEYGGTDGLLTIEDLVEQIVGEIEDEHDEEETVHIVKDPKQGLIAAARTPIEDLEEHLGQKLITADEEEDIDTLGGLVFTTVGRVPTRGELVRHSSGFEFEVLDADPRRVKTLKIHAPRRQNTSKAQASKPGTVESASSEGRKEGIRRS